MSSHIPADIVDELQRRITAAGLHGTLDEDGDNAVTVRGVTASGVGVEVRLGVQDGFFVAEVRRVGGWPAAAAGSADASSRHHQEPSPGPKVVFPLAEVEHQTVLQGLYTTVASCCDALRQETTPAWMPAPTAFSPAETPAGLRRRQLTQEHRCTAAGDPAGGTTTAVGLSLIWQDGPLGPPEARREPNGTFVEDVIAAAVGRLEFYQASRFACSENAAALAHLRAALAVLDQRTRTRLAQGVEGRNLTHR